MITDAPPAPLLLSNDDTAFYRAEGYLIIRGLFRPEEVRRLGADIDRVSRERTDLIDPNNMRVRFQKHHETNEILFEVFDPISDLSPVAQEITRDQRNSSTVCTICTVSQPSCSRTSSFTNLPEQSARLCIRIGSPGRVSPKPS